MKAAQNLIFGIHPVMEALKAHKEFEKVFVKKGLKGESFSQLDSLLRAQQVPVQYVPVEKLNRMVGGNHQGVVAFMSLIEYKSIEEMVQRTFEAGKVPFIAIFDRITDVRNFGGMARTAECAGVDTIVIPDKGSAAITADALKTSAGALTRLDVCRVKDLPSTIQYLKDSGISIIAASEKATTPYFTSNLLEPIAIVMGSEEDGVHPAILKNTDHLIRIPMPGRIDSLNVGVAFGVVCFEVVRQRLNESPAGQ